VCSFKQYKTTVARPAAKAVARELNFAFSPVDTLISSPGRMKSGFACVRFRETSP
jgi:hypothetical protein